MSLNDPLAGVLSALTTYDALGKSIFTTTLNSKFIQKILTILKDNGYLGSFKEIQDSKGNLLEINLIGNVNKAGAIKPRFYAKVDDFIKFEKRYLPAKDFGVIIISTNQGVMTLDEARKRKIGGKLIAFCY